jgi:hypothetical protein
VLSWSLEKDIDVPLPLGDLRETTNLSKWFSISSKNAVRYMHLGTCTMKESGSFGTEMSVADRSIEIQQFPSAYAMSSAQRARSKKIGGRESFCSICSSINNHPFSLVSDKYIMSALLWQCVRNNNAFLKKGHGPVILTAEPSNMTGVHNNKFSGLAGKNVAGVTVVKKGNKQQIAMFVKTNSGRAACPGKAFTQVGVSKCAKKGTNCITKQLAVYRPDLVSAANAKYQKIKRTFRARK